jgi:hypothetical protein
LEQNYFICHKEKNVKCKTCHGKNEEKGEFGSPWSGFPWLKGGTPIMFGPLWYLLHNIGTKMPKNCKKKKNTKSCQIMQKKPCAKTNGMHSILMTRNSQTITKVLRTILHFGSCILKRKKGSIYFINTTKKLWIDWGISRWKDGEHFVTYHRRECGKG